MQRVQNNTKEMWVCCFVHSNGTVEQTNAFQGQNLVEIWLRGILIKNGSNLVRFAKLDRHLIGCPDDLARWQSELQQNVTISGNPGE